VFFLFGTVFPDLFWATHFVAFLPLVLKFVFLLAAATLIIWGSLGRIKIPNWTTLRTKPKYPLVVYLCVAIGFGLICYLFPIHTDLYGDSVAIQAETDVIISQWQSWLATELFSFNVFDFKIGEATFYSMVNMGSYLTGAHGHQVVMFLGILSGIVFAFLWMVTVSLLIKDRVLRFLLVFAGISAPFLFVFYGHFEIYSTSFPSILAFFLSVILYSKTKKKRYLWLMILLNLVAIKLHFTSFFLIPATLLTIVFHLSGSTKFKLLFTWRKLSQFLLLPIFILGAVVYLFVTKSFNGGRNWSSDTLSEFVFLPVSSSDGPPLDRYDLFSSAHIYDFLSLGFVWSAAIAFLLVMITVLYRKSINWNSFPVLVVGITLIIYVTAFAVLNPLLGMSTDWDLFSMPAPALLVFTLLLASQIPGEKLVKDVGGAFLGLALLGVPVFIVNANENSLSQRLERKGVYDFKTYWKGASAPIIVGLNLEADSGKKELRARAVIEELKPYAIIGKDTEYSAILCEMGLHYSEGNQDLTTALEYFKLGYKFDPWYRKNVYHLVLEHHNLRNFDEGFIYSEALTQVQYPNVNTAFRLSILIALQANQPNIALTYCENYVKMSAPFDQLIENVGSVLAQGAKASDVLDKFYSIKRDVAKVQEAYVPSDIEEKERLTTIASRLSQAVKGNDSKYAKLLSEMGTFYSEVKHDVPLALNYFNQAYEYDSLLDKNIYFLVLGNFHLGEMDKAFRFTNALTRSNYPSINRAYRVAIHISLAAKEYEVAKTYCIRYWTQKGPEDQLIRDIQNVLSNGSDPSQALNYFKPEPDS